MATTTELETDTFDELYARIGSVPFNRIRTKPAGYCYRTTRP